MQQTLKQKKVSFQSAEQRLALKTVLKEQTLLMMMLLTGRGKSLLFMTSECLTDAGVTIMMASFQALVDDLVEQMKKTQIDCLK